MKLAWKEIRYYKAKYFLIEVILVLMIFMVLFLSGLANGLSRAVSFAIENIDAQTFVVQSDVDNLIPLSSLNDEQLDEIKSQTSAEVETLNIQRLNLNLVGQDKKLDVTYFVVDDYGFLNPDLKEGRTILNKQGFEIVLDISFKDDGIIVGDYVEDTATKIIMRVVGFTTDKLYGHTPVGYITPETYLSIKKVLNPEYVYSYNAFVIRSHEFENKLKLDGVDVVSKDTIVNHIPGYSAEQTTINMIVWVLVVISAAIVGVFSYVLTVQKEHQFGVLKAIGMSMKELSVIVVGQILLISFIGMIVGNILVSLMSMVLPNSMPFYIERSSALLVSGAFILISIFSGLISLRRIAKVDPIISIGGHE